MVISMLAATEAVKPTGIAVLGVNPQAFLLQLLTFVVLFAILKKFAFGKIVDILEQRRKTIDDGIRLGREMESKQATLEQTVDSTLRQARADADRILAEAHTEAGELVKQAEMNAQAKIDGMMRDAQVRIDQDIKRAHAQLERDVLTLVADATEAVLMQKVDADTDRALIERALESVKA